MELQDFDADPPVDSAPGLPQGLRDALSHLLDGNFAFAPRPPSGSLDETKRKASRPPQVLPRLLRKAPPGLTANLKGLRSIDTDDEDAEAADLGYPIVIKRSASSLRERPALTHEQASLIMRTKPKPAGDSNADLDAFVPPSPPRPAPCSNGGAPGGLAAVHSTYSVVRRTSSCRFSEGLPSSVVESLQDPTTTQEQQQQQSSPSPSPSPHPSQSQQPLLFQQPQPPHLQQHMQQLQQLQLQQLQRLPSQGGARLGRQNLQPLVPSAQRYSSQEFDRASDGPYGIKASGGLFEARATSPGPRSRSSTPTNRAGLTSHQQHRVSQGYVGGPPALGAGGLAVSGGVTPFGATSGLAAAAAADGGGGSGGGGAISAPVGITGSSMSYPLGGSGSSSGGARSPLTSPLSAPPLFGVGVGKPGLFRAAFAAGPSRPHSPAATSPMPPSAPSPPLAQHSSLSLPHHSPASAAAAAAASHIEPGGGSGFFRSSSRRFGAQVTAAAAAAAAATGGKGLFVSAAVERGGGSGPLALNFLPSSSAHSFSGLPRPALGFWPSATTVGSSGGDPGGDDELSVVRRSSSAVASVAMSTFAAFEDGSEGCGGDQASAGVVLDDVSDSEAGDEGGGGGEAAAAAASVYGEGMSRRGGGNIGELLTEFSEQGPMSAAARQLAALHRAREKARARKAMTKRQQKGDLALGTRWRSAV